MTGIKVLSVASEIYPLVKTGGLADVVGALPLALRRHGVETVTLVPGYPAVKAALGQTREILAGSPPTPAALTSLSSTRRISSTGPAIRMSGATAATGRTTRFASVRWDGSRRASGAVTPRASRRISSTATTGRPGWRWPISPMATGAVRRPC
jgi:hypothetical protein